MWSPFLSTIYPKELLKRRIGGGFLLLLSHFISQRHKELLVRERPLGQSRLCPWVYLGAASAAPSSARPCHGRAIASHECEDKQIWSLQGMFPAPPPPHTHTEARPANAPVLNAALGMETEMFEGPHKAVTCTKMTFPRIRADPLKATPRCKERAKGGELRGAKSWALQGWFLLMPKLPPPAVAGILSQLGCRSHLGACGDLPYLKALEELSAQCWTGYEGRRHSWITVPCVA